MQPMHMNVVEYLRNESAAIYAIKPISLMGLFDSNLVSLRDIGVPDTFSLQLLRTRPSERRRGNGTVLLCVAAEAANEAAYHYLNGRITSPQNKMIEAWFSARGFRIENGRIFAEVETVLGICGQLLADRGITYAVKR